jgi:type I restriction enzyme R subunit
MGLNESDTRAKLIDPTIHACGWTEDLIKREEAAGAIEIVEGKPRKRARAALITPSVSRLIPIPNLLP